MVKLSQVNTNPSLAALMEFVMIWEMVGENKPSFGLPTREGAMPTTKKAALHANLF